MSSTGLLPGEFTAVRNAKVAEARTAGLADVAVSLKKLRKPSVGAWLANLLVRERPNDMETLMELGDSLRGAPGEEWRRRNPEGLEEEGRLHLRAHSTCTVKGIADGSPGFCLSSRGTRDDARRRFCGSSGRGDTPAGFVLTTGLRYSGLGFTVQPDTGSPAAKKGSGPAREIKPEAQQIAKRDLDKATSEAEEADAQVKTARYAVKKEATASLTRLKSAEAQAVKRSKEAHARAAAAKKKLNTRLQ